MREGYCCVSVYASVPALAASASVETSKQRYSRVSLGFFDRWIFEKPSVRKLWREKANELELTAWRFCALSGPAKRMNCLDVW